MSEPDGSQRRLNGNDCFVAKVVFDFGLSELSPYTANPAPVMGR